MCPSCLLVIPCGDVFSLKMCKNVKVNRKIAKNLLPQVNLCPPCMAERKCGSDFYFYTHSLLCKGS